VWQKSLQVVPKGYRAYLTVTSDQDLELGNRSLVVHVLSQVGDDRKVNAGLVTVSPATQ
jgi:hypothetical protein